MTYSIDIDPDFITRVKTKDPNLSIADLLAIAYGYDQITYLYYGFESCDDKKPECVIQAIINNRDYKSKIISDGFNKQRTFSIIPAYQVYKNGELQRMPLTEVEQN